MTTPKPANQRLTAPISVGIDCPRCSKKIIVLVPPIFVMAERKLGPPKKAKNMKAK